MRCKDQQFVVSFMLPTLSELKLGVVQKEIRHLTALLKLRMGFVFKEATFTQQVRTPLESYGLIMSFSSLFQF